MFSLKSKKNKGTENTEKVDKANSEKSNDNINEKVKLDTSKKDEIEATVKRELEEKEPELKKDKKAFKKKVKDEVKKRTLIHNETLSRVAPSGNIKFRDIDFITNGKFATILTFSVKKGSFTDLPPLWGMGLVPKIDNVEEFENKDIVSKVVYSITRRKDEWAEKKVQSSTSVSRTGYSESKGADQTVANNYFQQYYVDTQEIANEINNGASYLDLSIRVTITAPTRDDLYNAIYYLEKRYTKHFNNKVELVPFAGEMKTEYSNLMDSAREQRGENYHLTSRELAGSYPFVSSGVNDMNGSYIGQLHGELNSDPVLLDTTNIDKLGVICAKNRAADINSVNNFRYDFKATTAWSNKITQDAFVNGNRVIEYVLNGEHVERMREELLSETAYINLLAQDVAINFLEPFADGQDDMSAYNVTISKIQEIARQFSEKEDENDITTLNSQDISNIEKELRGFYIHEGMWKENAVENKADLRFVGLKHNELPVLKEFIAYLAESIHAEKQKSEIHGTTDKERSLERIKDVFDKMKSRNEDLFNRQTTIDESALKEKMKVIFDFKMLKETHHAALMGQFVNSLAYGEQMLEEDDVVIIHGADELTDSVKRHLRTRIGHLNNRGVKVFLLYNDADVLFDKGEGSNENIHRIWFRNADLRITNSMQPHNVKQYAEIIRKNLPDSVQAGMQSNKDHIYYLNRDTASALFRLEIAD
ncbi:MULTISPECIES: hypothetical protein [Staphylococcus]|uniref:hypothetical protein n=1 Tax=Staphylococcus TaxID=1279 RepID=UPI0011CA1884|nr:MULTISPECIES: hypothetical protein [Staphylococcus]MEB6279098.1 hypothetical protein [Staphylococcus gallinarum]